MDGRVAIMLLIFRQHVADVMETLRSLFESSPESPFSVERRLFASWKSLLKVKEYEEVRSPPSVIESHVLRSIVIETRGAKLASYENLR